MSTRLTWTRLDNQSPWLCLGSPRLARSLLIEVSPPANDQNTTGGQLRERLKCEQRGTGLEMRVAQWRGCLHPTVDESSGNQRERMGGLEAARAMYTVDVDCRRLGRPDASPGRDIIFDFATTVWS
ncbi:hypothetical protein RRG08_029213 [Elysia crispata]|uniref:Uncharacterized protein n=1 Tax=Elysia crispata TaxID=231223 RepID=A0AAE1AJI0_9GAST|nr:hypothetical protein RRG08_029213 [Elysia crispata]